MGQRWSYSRCVYILESGGLYKIGRTHHLDQWLEQLRSASAHPISVFHVFQTVQDTLLERAIHALCAGDRVHGEWFRLSMRDLVAIKSMSVGQILAAAEKLKPVDPNVQLPLDLNDA